MLPSSWFSFIENLEKNRDWPVLIPILKKTKVSSFTNGSLLILCPNLGMKFFLETRKDVIEKNFSEFIGNSVRVNFMVKKLTKSKRKISPPLLKFTAPDNDIYKIAGLQRQYKFDNFAVSSSNQIAFSAAYSIAENPQNTYNPLFIYGGVGVGKTHLLQAIGVEILNKWSFKKVLYCSSEDFTNDLIESIKAKSMYTFRKKYRKVDALLIDDVQFIAGKNTIQEEFFHTFNTLIKHGGQVVLSSDQPPKAINKLEDRLKSRFSGGLTIDIQDPGFELRTAILLIKTKERNIEIDIEAAKIIAEQTTDTRELEGRLLGIYTKILKDNKIVTTEDVQKDIKKQETTAASKLDVQDIIRIVCSYYNVKPSLIKKQIRKEKITLPRQVIMFILRDFLKLKLEEIAYLLKRKDHTTIIHGVNKITNLILKNPSFKSEIDRIMNLLSLSTYNSQ